MHLVRTRRIKTNRLTSNARILCDSRSRPVLTFHSMLRGGSGSDVSSAEARQRNREARWGRAGSPRIGPRGAAPRALAGAPLYRLSCGASANLIQLRSGAAPGLVRECLTQHRSASLQRMRRPRHGRYTFHCDQQDGRSHIKRNSLHVCASRVQLGSPRSLLRSFA